MYNPHRSAHSPVQPGSNLVNASTPGCSLSGQTNITSLQVTSSPGGAYSNWLLGVDLRHPELESLIIRKSDGQKTGGNMCISQETKQRLLFKCTCLNNLYQRSVNDHRGIEYSFGLLFTAQEDLPSRSCSGHQGCSNPGQTVCEHQVPILGIWDS